MSVIELLVELYREVGTPDINEGGFEAKLNSSRKANKFLSKLPKTLIREIIVDGEEIDSESLIDSESSDIVLEVKIPSSSSSTFYSDVDDLISRCKELPRGNLPECFYITGEDFLSSKDQDTPDVSNLKRICTLIKELSKLSHYHDIKPDGSKYNLVFLGENNTPTVISTEITNKILSHREIDTRIISDLCKESSHSDPHHNVKSGVLSSTINELFKNKNNNSITHLIQRWDEFLTLYNNNLSTYLSGFSFHKAKKEVADEEVLIAEKLSSIINETFTKTLGIPLSLAVLIPITSSKSLFESALLVLGVTLTSLIISEFISHQQTKLKRVINAKEIIFSSLEGRRELYPDDLNNQLTSIINDLSSDEEKLATTLKAFRVSSWGPSLAAVYIHLSTQGKLDGLSFMFNSLKIGVLNLFP